MKSGGKTEHFQAPEEAYFLNKESNMVIEATENSLAAMLINQAKGLRDCKCTETNVADSPSNRSYTNIDDLCGQLLPWSRGNLQCE